LEEKMMRWFMLIGVVVCLASSTQAQDASKVAEEFANKWVTAYNSGNPEGVAALFTTDGIWSPATAELFKGREAIAKTLAARIKLGFTKQTQNPTEAHQDGNVIWASGEYSVFGSGETAGKQFAGRYGVVYVRDNTGNWHIAMITGNGGMKPLQHHACTGGNC
jgi:uncharacterized protein (TIGR02246 family)